MTTAVAPTSAHPTTFEKHEPLVYEGSQTATSDSQSQPQSHDVIAQFNYYKDPGDGSLPPPSYVEKPETYERPSEPLTLTVHDIRGEEDQYSLDKTGFQIFEHVSREKAFADDEEIKRSYYPEIEEILKTA